MTKRSRRVLARLAAAAGVVLVVSLGAAAWRRSRAPRAWGPGEVKVAFWSWRARTPSREEVERAARATGACVIFLRAGQFDFEGGRLSRIRAVEGDLPGGVELHLVYNATPALLAGFERVDERALAALFVETFNRDSERARVVDESSGVKNEGGVRVAGLQLDLDVPTRLLPRYGRVLRATRAAMPTGARLSVTGLPTWMSSAELKGALGAVDFWLPQFYGAEIPQTVDALVPVSSPARVRREVARARELGVPFYAGLAAYGYALLYSREGRLLEMRGDIDPARVASVRGLEMAGRRAFEPNEGGGGAAPAASEWRYVFRAQEAVVVDGLVVRAGERVVLDVPSSESLRASVRGVREAAGEKLLGICLFRLPTRGDATVLRLAQVAAALRDREAGVSTSVRLAAGGGRVEGEGGSDEGTSDEGAGDHLVLEATNDGEAGALFGEDALTLTVRVPRGSVRGLAGLDGFDSFESLCESAAGLRPCSAARATVLRLRSRTWVAGASARAGLSFEGETPKELQAVVSVRADDGRTWGRTRRASFQEVGAR